MDITEIRARVKVSEALDKFADAASTLNIAWIDDFIDVGYPFSESFDEVSSKITEWRWRHKRGDE